MSASHAVSLIWLQCAALAIMLLGSGCGAERSLDAIEIPAMAKPSQARLLERQGNFSAWEIGGLKVLHQATPGRETSAAIMYFVLDAEARSSASSDLDVLTLIRAEWRGSHKYTPQEQLDKMRGIAAETTWWAGRDADGLGVHCLANDLPLALDVLLAALAHPTFEYAFSEDNQKLDVEGVAPGNLPGAEAWELGIQTFWKGHPYLPRLGRDAKLGAYTRDDFVRRHSELLDAQRMLLVVVGAIDERRLLELVEPVALELPIKKPALAAVEVAARVPEAPHVEVLERRSGTYFVNGFFAGPAYGAEDHSAALVAAEVLSHRLFERVRTERGLGYYVDADFVFAGAGSGHVSFSSPDPNQTARLVLEEVRKLATSPPSMLETEQSLSLLTTWHLQNSQSPTDRAAHIFDGYLYTRNWHFELGAIERLRAVTPNDVQKVIAKYVKHIQFSVVGSGARIDSALFESL